MAQQQQHQHAEQQKRQQQYAAEEARAVQAERALLLRQLEAQKAHPSEGLSNEQLQAQHRERWWGGKQVRLTEGLALNPEMLGGQAGVRARHGCYPRL